MVKITFLLIGLIILGGFAYLLVRAIRLDKLKATKQVLAVITMLLFVLNLGLAVLIIRQQAAGEKQQIDHMADQYLAWLDKESGASQSKALESALQNLVSDLTEGQVGIAVFNQEGKKIVAINDQADFITASTYKPLLAAAALYLVEEGEITASQEERIKQLTIPTIQWSDNDRAITLGRDIVNYDRFNQIMHDWGFQTFRVETSGDYSLHITPEDLARFYQELEQGKLLNSEHTAFLLEQLQQSQEPIPFDEALAGEDNYWNKYGLLTGIYNESGIYKDAKGKSYYLAVMTSDWLASDSEKTDWFKQLAEVFSQYLYGE